MSDPSHLGIYKNIREVCCAGATAYHTDEHVRGGVIDFNCNGSEPTLLNCQFNSSYYLYGDYAGVKCCE